MDLAAMAMSISMWQMQNFQRDVSATLMRGAMDDVVTNMTSLADSISASSAPMTGMMDILV